MFIISLLAIVGKGEAPFVERDFGVLQPDAIAVGRRPTETSTRLNFSTRSLLPSAFCSLTSIASPLSASDTTLVLSKIAAISFSSRLPSRTHQIAVGARQQPISEFDNGYLAAVACA